VQTAHSSAAEHALETQRIGSLQIAVVAICFLIQMCDGYDIGAIGWSVPSLTHAWQLPPPAFTWAFAFSNIGIMAGALVASPFADRFGRKPLLLASIAIFGLASLATAVATTIHFLAVCRFFTGFGIAGTFAGTVALTGDFAPQRLRATMIMVCFTGAPAGGFIGGQIVALLLHQGFGWQIIFILGAAFPLALLLIMALFLPESPRFLARRANLSARQRALLARLDIAPDATDAAAVDIARGNPIAMLFGEGYALSTILLWIIFFCSLLNLYLFGFWLPEVLHLVGMTPAAAVFASSLRDFGAIWAVLYLGLAIDRFGPQRALALHYIVGGVFIALIALVAMPYAILLAVIFFSGMTIIGSQTGANATAGALYPARMRASGIGWALGIGRLGGIAAPLLGGWLLKIGVAPLRIFLGACVFAVIAAVCTALLRVRAGQLPHLAITELTS
jgi:MFS transporter, AAHS family, 4-hydroxybenzoate transporter